MKHYLPVETHTHSNHSDGDFTVDQLLKAAYKQGYKGIILTDHNTYTGHRQIHDENLLEKYPLVLLDGIELTTYYGHLLIWNSRENINWSNLTSKKIDKTLKKVQESDGLTCIAHPYEMGSPFSTGSFWELDIKDYNYLTAIEIWNETNPQDKTDSQRAYDMWLDLLDKGYRLNCHTGRDWHRFEDGEANYGVVYLESASDKLDKDSFVKLLRRGQYYISLGPVLNWQIGQIFLGEQVSKADLINKELTFTIEESKISDLNKFRISDLTFKLYNNHTLITNLQALAFNKVYQVKLPQDLEEGYLRFEVEANYRGSWQKVLISNPIFVG